MSKKLQDSEVREEVPWYPEPTREQIDNNAGFVYLVTVLETGQKYIGRKYFWNNLRVKVSGRKNRKRKSTESNWRHYITSSKRVQKIIKTSGLTVCSFEILHLASTRARVNYLETKEQFVRDVLGAKSEDGSEAYLNDQILSRYFKPKEAGTPEYESKRFNISTALKAGYTNGTIIHPLKGKQHPNKGKKLPQTGHKKRVGYKHYNDGTVNINLKAGDSVPAGFRPGVLNGMKTGPREPFYSRYMSDPKICPQCNSIVPYERRLGNKFCSMNCYKASLNAN